MTDAAPSRHAWESGPGPTAARPEGTRMRVFEMQLVLASTLTSVVVLGGLLLLASTLLAHRFDEHLGGVKAMPTMSPLRYQKGLRPHAPEVNASIPTAKRLSLHRDGTVRGTTTCPRRPA